jgi:hypothetical protein
VIAAICIVQMAIILPMVERVRAYKNESRNILWSRRSGFAIGVATLLYAGISQNWQVSCTMMALACVAIFTVNIISLRAQNHNPLHGHRFLSRSSVTAFFRRYP